MTVGLLSFVSQSAFTLSGRNIININQLNLPTTDYAMIDHIRSGVGNVSMVSADFATGAMFTNVIDANGWVNNGAVSGQKYGGGFEIPDTANFAGPYTLDFTNTTGIVSLVFQSPVNAVFTPSSAVNCSVTFNASGAIQLTGSGGGAASIQISIAISDPGPHTMAWNVVATGSPIVKNIRFYRTADATDLGAGKIWRSAWKQPLVNLCPAAIRFMNCHGGNSSLECRFENRTLPTNAGLGAYANWTSSPVYASNATGTNQYACVAAVPNASNTKNTPASMVHGEIATIRFTNGFARCTFDGDGLGAMQVTGISSSSPAQVTTDTAHGYSTGDIIGHYFNPVIGTNCTSNSTTTVSNVTSGNLSLIVAGMFVFGPGVPANTTVVSVTGSSPTASIVLSNAMTFTNSSGNLGLAFYAMKNLHQFPCKITVTGTTTYTIQTVGSVNINGATLGTFSVGKGVRSYQFVTLSVGSGNDRTSYPITTPDSSTPASFFSNAFLKANDYKTFYFDKTCSAQTDGSGNYLPGVWRMVMQQINGIGHTVDYPLEICVALINELNAMSPAHTIGMHLNISAYGLSSMDPDYTTASDWAINAVDVVINPSSSVRVGGYSALGYSGSTKLNSPVLALEYSNELWPSGTSDGFGYVINRGIQHFGGAILPYDDWQDMKALRSTCWVRDVKSSIPPNSSQIKYLIGMWGSTGFAPGNFGGNYETANGGNVTANPVFVGDFYTNDSLVTGGSWGTPISNHDGVCPATYFDPYDTYFSGGQFATDSSTYALGGSTNQNTAIASFVAAVVDAGNVHSSESTTRYATVVLPQFSANLPVGKIITGYEGGPDWQTFPGKTTNGGHTMTSADSLFVIAVLNSSQWATAQVNFFNAVNAISKCFMPSIYIWIGGAVGDQRWCYCSPDSYASGTEGAGLTVNNAAWIAMGNRNQALPN